MRDHPRGAARLRAALPAAAGVCVVLAGPAGAVASSDEGHVRLIDLEAGRAPPPGCVESSEVHGYRSCREFGWWARRWARLSLEVASLVGWIDPGRAGPGGGRRRARTVGEPRSQRAPITGLAVRAIGHHGWLHAGVELGAAAVGAGPAAAALAEPSLMLTAGAVAGASTRCGAVTLGGELMAGVRALVVEPGPGAAGATTVAGGELLAVRARADLWLSPRVTAGGFLDRDLLTGDVAAGLSLAYHVSAYDGR